MNEDKKENQVKTPQDREDLLKALELTHFPQIKSSDHWESLKKKHLTPKTSAAIKSEIEEGLNEIKENKDKFQFEKANKKLNDLIEKATNADFDELNTKLLKLKEKVKRAEKEYKEKKEELNRLEIELEDNMDGNQLDAAFQKCTQIIGLSQELNEHKKEERYTELHSELERKTEKKKEEEREAQELAKKEEKLEILEGKLENNLNHNYLRAALQNCTQIIELSKELDDEEKMIHTQELKAELKERIRRQEEREKEEQKELYAQAEKLDEVVQTKEDVLPLMDEFSAIELIGDISNDISEMLDQVGGLIDEHRVEVKDEISNKTLLKTKSGEVIEYEQEIKVPEPKDSQKKTELNLESGFENPFDDIIEEAIVTDLIPYNFEIDEVELNGEKVVEFPDKKLKKEGLELNWKLNDIAPRKKVNLNYSLRRRVSRTIIFILKEEVKVIKTHSRITERDIEGFFEAELPFTNSFGTTLKGVVVEDIIPLYYIHFIEEPKNLLPNKITETNSGDLLKWDIESLDEKTLNYHYNLLELYKFEELKITLNQTHKQAIENLNNNNFSEALDYFKKIRNSISTYVE